MPNTSKKSILEQLASPGVGGFVAAVITVLLGLLAGLILLAIVSTDSALQGFQMLITGGFRNIGVVSGIGRVMYYSVPLILCGLAVGFTLKTNIFNIGVAGQYLMGLVAALYVAIYFHSVFGPATWLFSIIGGAAAGAAWGCIQGLIQAFFKVNAIICGIMMNYIAVFSLNMLMEASKQVYVRGRGWTQMVDDEAVLPKFGLDSILGHNTTANGGFVIAILLCVLAWWLLKKTTLGYELKAVGYNDEASRYAGVNIKKSMILSMTIAGAFAGLAGAMNHLGASGTRYAITDTLPTQGFTGISVALIASSNPIGIIFSGILIAFFQVGGVSMQSLGLEPQLVSVITSVIIYFCAFNFVIKALYMKLIKRMISKNKGEGEMI